MRKGWGFCSALSASGVGPSLAGRTANALARRPRLAPSRCAGVSNEAGGFRAGFQPIAGRCLGLAIAPVHGQGSVRVLSANHHQNEPK